MKIPKTWRIISLLAWIACTLSIGYGLYGAYMYRLIYLSTLGQITMNASLIQSNPKLYFEIQEYIIQLAQNMNSDFEFINTMFWLAGIFSVIAILTSIIDFFIIRRRLKQTKK